MSVIPIRHYDIDGKFKLMLEKSARKGRNPSIIGKIIAWWRKRR